MNASSDDGYKATIHPIDTSHDLLQIVLEKNEFSTGQFEAAMEFFRYCNPNEALAAMHKLMIQSGFIQQEPFTLGQSSALLEVLQFLNALSAAKPTPDFPGEDNYKGVAMRFTKDRTDADFHALLQMIITTAKEAGIEVSFPTN